MFQGNFAAFLTKVARYPGYISRGAIHPSIHPSVFLSLSFLVHLTYLPVFERRNWARKERKKKENNETGTLRTTTTTNTSPPPSHGSHDKTTSKLRYPRNDGPEKKRDGERWHGRSVCTVGGRGTSTKKERKGKKEKIVREMEGAGGGQKGEQTYH